MENAGSAAMSRFMCAPRSATGPHLSQLKPLWVAIALCLSLLGCSSGSDHGAAIGLGDGGTSKPPPNMNLCGTPAEGCACDTEAENVECGQVERVSGDYVSCSMGHRTCNDGVWGACVGDSVSTLHIPASKQRIQVLGTGMDCPDNPCDPYCRVQTDSPTDLPLPDGGVFSNDGGLQVVPHEVVAADGTCTSMTVSPTPQTLTVTGLPATGAGLPGLVGEYFNQVDKTVPQLPGTWVPLVTRIDPNIDFDWSGGNGVTTFENYSVRWTGVITPPSAGSYTLCLTTDDGSRLWVDGDLIVDGWYDHGTIELCNSTPLNWASGSQHSIRVEYFQGVLSAAATLTWGSGTIPKQVVPASAFTQAGSTMPLSVTGTGQFQIVLAPAGCFAGTPQPAWTLDRLDLATINGTGKVGLISAVAGPINVTAYLGKLSASGVLNVNVDVADNSAAPMGAVATFNGTAAGTDPGLVLYPYDQTVLPLGLRPPRVQWDAKGSPASAVKVSLRYPATGIASFNWSETLPESNPPQAGIPPQVWTFFEQTAKGQVGGISVQRIIGGAAKLPMTRTLTFANAPVRGKIFYTQYHRGSDANEMVVDPGSSNAAQPAFGSTDGCPVCHTVSANGNVFATSSRVGLENNSAVINFSPTLGGVSSVNTSTGSLTPIADFVGDPPRPNYTADSVDWRGFGWAPLTPDGSLALVATNVWGNTNENLVGINGGTRQVNTGNVMLSGGSGTGLLAQYYATTDNSFGTPVWKRFDPQVNFDFGTGSPGGPVPVNFSVKRTGRIQAFFSETYHFELVTTSTDIFSLTVGAGAPITGTGPTTIVGDVAMTAGTLTNFVLTQRNTTGVSNVQLYWSSPSTPRAVVPQTQLYWPAAEPMHGANVVYKNDSGTPTVTVVEPDIAPDWVGHGPSPAIGPDNWTSTWDAKIESPFAGSVQLCIDADDGVTVNLDGTQLIQSPQPPNNAYAACGAAKTWTLGSQHDLHIDHHEAAAQAHLTLTWVYNGVTEVVPSTYIYPKTVPTPTNGLTATYYDVHPFNTALLPTQTKPRAFQRVDPNIDFDWDTGRPNYSVISDDDTFSGRWTGTITMPCTGMYEFRTNGNVDDGGRLWVDDSRVMGRWSYGALQGAGYFATGAHDFKFDWFDDGSNAVARLQWKTPCGGVWTTIPTSVFTPNSSYTRTTGYVVDGGDNGNNTSYWVWKLPTAAAPTPVDVTPTSPANWGLSGTSMMVPSFSPDGSKLVFIDGDSAGGAGWRKGLSTLDFDPTAKTFRSRRLVTSTWPLGDAMKWPTFESDSRSVIYQSTLPGDSCCRRGNTGYPPIGTFWKKYGYMGPTNYYEDPGRLWSIDTQAATPSPVALTKLNSGEQAKDANKSYQPTMLPVAAGGYRWVVFTSTRPYGNTLNLPAIQQDFSSPATYATSTYTGMTNYQDIQSQLWVAAIDDSASGAADRSHPGFWLPSQNFSGNAASGYVNERGYWVADACHPAGTTAASNCEVDEDCCGGTGMTKTSACRLDTPLTNPPTRHCHALPAPGVCVAMAGSCAMTANCCDGLACIGAICAAPPPAVAIGAANYERIYASDCADGMKPVWRFFDWQTVTPATGSKLEFWAETMADPSMFVTLPVAPIPIDATDVVQVGTATGAPVTVWTGNSVDQLLTAKMLKSQKYLKITVRFVPNADNTASPILKNWRQSYSCEPAE